MLDALGTYEEAVASYDRALALRPRYAEAWSNRGNALNHMLRHEEALASCDRALAIDPAHAEAWSNRGNALEFLHRFDEALTCYEKVISLRPTLARAFFSRQCPQGAGAPRGGARKLRGGAEPGTELRHASV